MPSVSSGLFDPSVVAYYSTYNRDGCQPLQLMHPIDRPVTVNGMHNWQRFRHRPDNNSFSVLVHSLNQLGPTNTLISLIRPLSANLKEPRVTNTFGSKAVEDLRSFVLEGIEGSETCQQESSPHAAQDLDRSLR